MSSLLEIVSLSLTWLVPSYPSVQIWTYESPPRVSSCLPGLKRTLALLSISHRMCCLPPSKYLSQASMIPFVSSLTHLVTVCHSQLVPGAQRSYLSYSLKCLQHLAQCQAPSLCSAYICWMNKWENRRVLVNICALKDEKRPNLTIWWMQGCLFFLFVFVFPLGLIFMFEIIYEKPRVPFGIEGTIFTWSVYQWLNWLPLHQTLLSKHLSLQKVPNLPAIKNFFSQDHTEQFFQNEKAGKIKVKDKSSPSRRSTLLLCPPPGVNYYVICSSNSQTKVLSYWTTSIVVWMCVSVCIWMCTWSLLTMKPWKAWNLPNLWAYLWR